MLLIKPVTRSFSGRECFHKTSCPDLCKMSYTLNSLKGGLYTYIGDYRARGVISERVMTGQFARPRPKSQSPLKWTVFCMGFILGFHVSFRECTGTTTQLLFGDAMVANIGRDYIFLLGIVFYVKSIL